MAPRAKKTADSPESWLIDGASATPSKSAKTEAADDFEFLAPAPKQDRPSSSASDEASEWLAVPESPSAPAAAPKTRRARRAAKKRKQRDELPAGDAERVIEAQRAEIATLSAQVRALEGELSTETKSHENREAQLANRIGELEAELTEAKTRKTVREVRRAKATTGSGTGTAKRKSTTTKAKTTARSKAGQRKAKAPARKAASSTTTKARRNGKLDLNQASFEQLRELGLSVTQSARLIAYRDVRGGYQSLDEIDDVPGLSEKTRDELKEQLQLGA